MSLETTVRIQFIALQEGAAMLEIETGDIAWQRYTVCLDEEDIEDLALGAQSVLAILRRHGA